MSALRERFKLATILFLSVQMSACGTILYPERRGRDAGRLDVGVVLLDAVWLLFGLIPGLIAFAVDFSTGAIYVPEGGDFTKLRTIRFDPAATSHEELEALISRETGQTFRFSDERVQYSRVKNKEEAAQRFAGLEQ